jgi:tRNA modification GTPase
VQIDGIPVNVIDTAGLRDAVDEVERLGIARTLSEIGRADVVLHLIDATAPAADAEVLSRVTTQIGRAVPLVTVFNKIDLTGEAPHADATSVHLSALDGRGIDLLRSLIRGLAGWARETSGETVFLARERHLHALRSAQRHLQLAADHADCSDRELDLLAEELRLAGNELGTITGAVSADDLLGLIFSRFCIGK